MATSQLYKEERDFINNYCKEIGKYSLLSASQEKELCERIERGDIEARNELVEANLRFVFSYVKKNFKNLSAMPFQDKIAAGNQGLITAAERFDSSRGFKFISYAVHWIKKNILREYQKNYIGNVRLPYNRQGLAQKVKKLTEEYVKISEGVMPPEWYLKKELGKMVMKNDVSIVSSFTHKEKSLDNHIGDGDSNISLSDVIGNHDSEHPGYELDKESQKQAIMEILDQLDRREQNIVKQYFGIDHKQMSLEEIGDEMGITKERVSQIKNTAIKRLRHPSRSNFLRIYL